MNKRLRKKKRRGEFTEYGFVVLALVPSLENAELTQFDDFIDPFLGMLEKRGVGFGGGVGSKVNGFCAKFDRGSCTEDDRAAVEKFLSNNSLVTNFKVGPLIDAWNGTEKEWLLDFDMLILDCEV